MIRIQITNGPDTRLSSGADFIQIREPQLSARELAEYVRRAMKLGPRILVNDRLDVALACGAAGVHLRSGSVSPAVVRRIAPAGFIVSVACHSEAEVQQAMGADFAILAPIFQPLSKAESRPPLGLDQLRRTARACSTPLIALGGITEANAAQCIEAGAEGIAGITLFQ